jgi:Iap family predicted aminopeptidase
MQKVNTCRRHIFEQTVYWVMRIFSIFPVMLLAACTGSNVQTPAPASKAPDAAATITPGDIYARISFLASDALKGRDTPSQGLEAAAAYIASEYRRLGLEPQGENGTYFQRYPYTIRTIQAQSARVDITTRDQTTTLKFADDFFAFAGTPDQTSGELIQIADKIEAGIPLNGRIPVVRIRGALDRAWRTAVINARNAAKANGASAMIVVLDSTITAADIRTRAGMFATTTGVTPVPTTVFVRADRARDVLGAGARAQITVPVTEVAHHPPNVIAVLRGSDPELRNTYVVLSAHMDHIGVSQPNAQGDSINNGADDDASGTAAVVEMAEAFASLPQRPARSIIFLNVSGEEKGLLGSQYFSEHPTVPLTSIVADINIDMIGRNAADTVVAIGQDYSSLGPLTQEVARAHPELHLTASRDIWPNERFFFRSDHYNFARKDIPAIFFFSGVHEDYHRPSDEVEKIDSDKAARIAKLAYYLAREIATRREPPKWTEQGLKEVRSLTR